MGLKFQKFIIIITIIILSFFILKVYQPAKEADNYYAQGLKYYKQLEYEKAYYTFSGIKYSSILKPAAIYRQAICAKALGDDKTELQRLEQLVKIYPFSRLSIKSRYILAKKIYNSHPIEAKIYFKATINSNVEEDYKYASEYYLAKIENKNSHKNIKALREYLKKYPKGNLAIDVAKTWINIDKHISDNDKLLIAKVYSLNDKPNLSNKILKTIKNDEGLVLKTLNAYNSDNKISAEDYLSLLVHKNSYSKMDQEIFPYILTKITNDYPEKNIEIFNNLLNISQKDFYVDILNEKCKNIHQYKLQCYKQLYPKLEYNRPYSEDALIELIMESIKTHDYNYALKVIDKFTMKFSDSQYLSQVYFWKAKIEKRNGDYVKAHSYYQRIINKYPDSYYAFRANDELNNFTKITNSSNIQIKKIEYPLKYPHKYTLLSKLLELSDYDLIQEYTNDQFVKSWSEYKKGNLAKSMILARDAINNLKNKPKASDLRWRLAYPENYMDTINEYSQFSNKTLILSIIKEESSFDNSVNSNVGAVGLMQIMPSTAIETAKTFNMDIDIKKLYKPSYNITIGSLYYKNLNSIFNGKDIYAVAAYNGGIGAVANWISNTNSNDIDEFVEAIPYEETKNYIKKVLKSYWNYERIYK